MTYIVFIHHPETFEVHSILSLEEWRSLSNSNYVYPFLDVNRSYIAWYYPTDHRLKSIFINRELCREVEK